MKTRKYRITILNISFDDDLIKQIVAEELGDEVQVENWEIEREYNFQGLVLGGGMMPQRLCVITLNYTETE